MIVLFPLLGIYSRTPPPPPPIPAPHAPLFQKVTDQEGTKKVSDASTSYEHLTHYLLIYPFVFISGTHGQIWVTMASYVYNLMYWI